MLNLSLLVCTKNSSKSIINCLKSALPILNAGAELILVDGRSQDNTIRLILLRQRPAPLYPHYILHESI